MIFFFVKLKDNRSKEEDLTCLQVKDILKGDLSKKGVAGIMRNGIILTDRQTDRQTDRRSMS